MMKTAGVFIIGALVILVVAVLIVIGSSRGSVSADWNVDIETALKMWQNKDAVIIDVRTPGEYQEAHIPGVVNIPLDQLVARASEVPATGKVLLICRSGNRSAQGTRLLREKGLTNVYNINQGMLSWSGPVEK